MKKRIFDPGWWGTKMCPEGSGIGRDKVEGVLYEARPVLIHLINLELATDKV